MTKNQHKRFMRKAIDEAIGAGKRGDYAMGAVMVKNGRIVALGGNRVKAKNDSSKHIELEIVQYCKGMVRERYLDGYVLYSTHEPCFLCLGACWWTGIREIYYGITQKQLDEYGKRYGTSNLRYRSSPVSSPGIIKKYRLPIKMELVENEMCKKALKYD